MGYQMGDGIPDRELGYQIGEWATNYGYGILVNEKYLEKHA